MSFESVIQKLKSDWSFIATFMSNPQLALEGAQLSPAERGALLTRNSKDLLKLGVPADDVVAALSGCHRQKSTMTRFVDYGN